MVGVYYGFPITYTELNLGDVIRFNYFDFGFFFRGSPRKVVGRIVGLDLRKNSSEKIKLENRFFKFDLFNIRNLEIIS